ncbi:alpha/beta fold hydrolase [Propionibacteriaceae bacterium Y1700]|uniref:alpha/beta fold hydrolase n=1 Tax=Microlunatus sp. Y1700 TaxID=3418487 RepID=UPI003DA74586
MTTKDDTSTAQTSGVTASADGTPIAWSRAGAGPALVMVHCVGVSRATTPQPTLAAALAEHFTVWTYDRRGKGESGAVEYDKGETYAVEREFEDLAAVIALADGPVTVYGFSSGATLALLAAEAGVPIERLTLLEPPLYDDPDPEGAFRAAGEAKLAEGNEVLQRWFQTDVVGVPAEILDQMPPSEEDLRQAPTLLHELTFLPGTPATRFSSVQQPTLVMASAATAPEMITFVEDLADALPYGKKAVLPGEWHGVDDATLTRAIVDFT